MESSRRVITVQFYYGDFPTYSLHIPGPLCGKTDKEESLGNEEEDNPNIVPGMYKEVVKLLRTEGDSEVSSEQP